MGQWTGRNTNKRTIIVKHSKYNVNNFEEAIITCCLATSELFRSVNWKKNQIATFSKYTAVKVTLLI